MKSDRGLSPPFRTNLYNFPLARNRAAFSQVVTALVKYDGGFSASCDLPDTCVAGPALFVQAYRVNDG